MGREWLDSAPRPLRMVPVVLQVLSGMAKEVYAFTERSRRWLRDIRLRGGFEFKMLSRIKLPLRSEEIPK